MKAVFLILATMVMLAAGAGCGGNTCDDAVDKLKSCGIQATSNGNCDSKGECAAKCTNNATCGEIMSALGNGTDNAYSQCVTACGM